jgi:hypothetical protein
MYKTIDYSASSAKQLHEWKRETMTISRDQFLRRHSWFQWRKDDCYTHLRSQCDVPDIYSTSKGLNIDQLRTLPPTFVLKKMHGHSSKQVLILTKDGDDYSCLLTRKTFNFEDLESWVEDELVITEKYLGDYSTAIPLDFKFYVVDAVPTHMVCINRVTPRPSIAFFTLPNFRRKATGEIFSEKSKNWLSMEIEFSTSFYLQAQACYEVAKQHATTVFHSKGVLFSLDYFYSDIDKKVYLGEVTPRPGALYDNWLKKSFIEELFSPLLAS